MMDDGQTVDSFLVAVLIKTELLEIDFLIKSVLSDPHNSLFVGPCIQCCGPQHYCRITPEPLGSLLVIWSAKVLRDS